MLNDVVNYKLVSEFDPVRASPDAVDNVPCAYVVTRSHAKQMPASSDIDDSLNYDKKSIAKSDSWNEFIDTEVSIMLYVKSKLGIANASQFANEQSKDKSLYSAWKSARQNSQS
jgi:hypothetical protein